MKIIKCFEKRSIQKVWRSALFRGSGAQFRTPSIFHAKIKIRELVDRFVITTGGNPLSCMYVSISTTTIVAPAPANEDKFLFLCTLQHQ